MTIKNWLRSALILTGSAVLAACTTPLTSGPDATRTPVISGPLGTLPDAPPTQADSPLTEREHEVLQSISRGERKKEIAHNRGITEQTVKVHLQSIYQKFNVDSRAAAVAVGAQKGLLGE